MLVLGGVAQNIDEGRARCEKAIGSGEALDLFYRNILRQGGSVSELLARRGTWRSEFFREIRADREGFIASVDALKIGLAGVHLGVGRNRTDDKVSPTAGFIFEKNEETLSKKGSSSWSHMAKTAKASIRPNPYSPAQFRYLKPPRTQYRSYSRKSQPNEVDKKDIDPSLVRTIARRYQIDPLTASILVRRNLTEPEQIRFYLEDDLQLLNNPFLFASMEDAIDRILVAREEEEKVLVFGDSDTDGITSTVLMTDALKDFGLDVFQKVPEGEEPYGLSNAAIDFAENNGISLIITVDCGISNHAEVAYARQKGIDVIITDHHHIQAPSPPEAVAVLDPKLPDSGYPFRDLSGCGVCLKVAHALAIARLGMYKEPLALLYVGTDPSAPEAKPTFVLEAARLDNLIETSRLRILFDPEGASDTHSRNVEIFFEGVSSSRGTKRDRCLFQGTLQGKRRSRCDGPQSARRCVLAQYDKEFSCRSHAGLEAKKYAREAPTAVDTLQSIFSAYIIHTLQSQGLLNERMFQLAALGTIADLMPLKDENRLIVRKGIEGINRAPTGGIRELKVSMNLAKPLEAIDIAWQITPTLNAAGRLGTPGLALNLLQADMVDHAMEAASQLIQANNERRRLGTEGWDIVRDKLNESLEQHGGKFAVVGSAEIKSGITGLLASRAANMMKVPVIVVAFKADGTCSGSIRSGAAFPLTKLLRPLRGPFFGLRGARLRRGLYPQDRPMAGLPNPSLRVHGPHRI